MHSVTLALEGEPSGGIAGWATGLVEAMGGPGAGIAIALENLFPPLPSEIILPLTGFAAGQGVLSLASALFWTTLGSVVGATALYWLGALLGRERMYAIWARLPLVKVSDLAKTEAWFAKHGRKAVFFGRMVPIFRSLISVPAGVERMPLLLFLVLTSLGSAIWNSVLVLAGYWLGDQWHVVENYVGVFSKVVLAAVVVAVVVFVGRRLLVKPARSGSGGRHRRT
ncbi:DedA family protein [Streptomyces sp. JJ66]|uniref:DedA family protein n=1 Tax=Streptomyces sp. JJ66 TaxID=2803843 RepID=UPI001C563565|nr:DedA family protein [Streptomyces sp. JJ66]MBW1601446.1 DedA family protein [Streptomyces sp. JJ66]